MLLCLLSSTVLRCSVSFFLVLYASRCRPFYCSVLLGFLMCCCSVLLGFLIVQRSKRFGVLFLYWSVLLGFLFVCVLCFSGCSVLLFCALWLPLFLLFNSSCVTIWSLQLGLCDLVCHRLTFWFNTVLDYWYVQFVPVRLISKCCFHFGSVRLIVSCFCSFSVRLGVGSV